MRFCEEGAWLRTALLPLFLQLSSADIYKFMTGYSSSETFSSDDTGTITDMGSIRGPVARNFTNPTVVVGKFGRPVFLFAWPNYASAGKVFASRVQLTASDEIVAFRIVPTDAAATLTCSIDGTPEFSATVSPPRLYQPRGYWSGKLVEINSTADVIVTQYSILSAIRSLVPAAQTIYGQCSELCELVVTKSDPSLPPPLILQKCTDGSVGAAAEGTISMSITGYTGVSCMWTVPDGRYQISGASSGDGGGYQSVSLVPPELFHTVTPLPTDMVFVLLISAGPARCTYGGSVVTLTGVTDIYHARLTGQPAGRVIECDQPVTAIGEALCPVEWGDCTNQINLIVAPLAGGATTSVTSSTTDTLTTTTNTSSTTVSTETSTPTTTTTTSVSFTTTSVSFTTTSVSTSTTVSMTSTSSLTATTTSSTSTSMSSTSTLTTTTTPTPSVPTISTVEAAAVLADRVESLEASLLPSLLEGNATSITLRVDGLVFVAAKFDAAAVQAAGGSLNVPVEGSDVAVSVPASLFANPNIDAEGVVLTVAAVDPASVGFPAGAGESEVQVASVVNVNLRSLDGNRLGVAGLVDPIKVVMPVNESEGLQCVFWDEASSGWASKGVELGPVEGGTVECLCSHLTLFAAIFRGFVSTFACSQVVLLNAESVRELGRGDWHRAPGAVVLWLLLTTFALLLCLGAWLDWSRWKQGRTSDEHFLIPLEGKGEEEDVQSEVRMDEEEGWGEENNEDEPGKESKAEGNGVQYRLRAWARASAATCVAGSALLADWCRQSGVVRDAVDEIFSQWADYFGEIRDFVEGLTEGLELRASAALRRDLMVTVVYRLMSAALVLSARRQAAASLGISCDVSALVMEDEDMFDVLLAHHTRKPERATDNAVAAGNPAREAALNEATVQEISFEATAEDVAAEEAAAKDAGAMEAAADEAAAASREGTAADLAEGAGAIGKGVAPEEAAVGEASAGEAAGEDAAAGKASVGEAAAGEAAAGEAAPGETAVGDATVENAALEEAARKEADVGEAAEEADVRGAAEEAAVEDASAEGAAAEGAAPEGSVAGASAAQETLPLGNSQGSSSKALAREEAWARLHCEVEAKLDAYMEASADWSSLPSTVWRLFLHQNPFSTCLVHCAFTSCKLRVLLFMVDVVGALMLTTVFFAAAGVPRKRSRALDCSFNDPFEFVGRVLAVGTGSLVIASIPAIVLGSLCTRGFRRFDYEGCPAWNRQLEIWRAQDRAIWVLSLLYLTFCLFFACLFLANVDRQDHGNWLLGGFISVVESIVIIPLAVALTLPLLAGACLHFMSRHRKATKAQLISERHLEFKRAGNMTLPIVKV